MASRLILMRHGQSIWNQKNLFTGWVDIPLSEKGIEESLQGGKKIQNFPIDIAFTSTLIRAQMTLVLALLHHGSGKVPIFHREHGKHHEGWSDIFQEETKAHTIPVYTAWELNERMYGKLQGLNKAETAQKYGAEQVQIWRRSYDVAPPDGESLEMTAARAIPYFQSQVMPQLQMGKNVFIAAHGNSLRAIVMHMEGLSKEEVLHLEIATGDPFVYRYDQGSWTKQS